MSEFQPGTVVPVAPAVWRVVAPNASLMTGPGTNTYLLGDPPTAVLDPGPADEAHLETIRRAAPRLELVLVTHTHADHSPGAAPLASLTGASRVGLPPPTDGRQDLSFQPDVSPAHDQVIQTAAGALRAIHTPGHASNHVCYLLETQGLLFSGDHVLDGVTPVILTPDGDMSAYMDSLRRLRTYPLQAIAPAHGRILADPVDVIDGVLAHRKRREAKVVAALEASGPCTLDQLIERVYDDVRPELHRWARLSLEAHLIKLEREGCCVREGWIWRALRK